MTALWSTGHGEQTLSNGVPLIIYWSPGCTSTNNICAQKLCSKTYSSVSATFPLIYLWPSVGESNGEDKNIDLWIRSIPGPRKHFADYKFQIHKYLYMLISYTSAILLATI